MNFKRLGVVLLLTFFANNLSICEEVKTGEHQINFFTGNFDFSDDKQKAILVGFQHQNENLYRDTLIRKCFTNHRWIYHREFSGVCLYWNRMECGYGKFNIHS
jgi:hypothetical protein